MSAASCSDGKGVGFDKVRPAEPSRLLEKDLIDRRPAGAVILLPNAAQGRHARHEGHHATLVRVLPTVVAGRILAARRGHDVHAVDHHHVLLERREGRALQREGEAGRRRAGVRTPVGEPRTPSQRVMDDQEPQRGRYARGACLDGAQQRNHQRRRAGAQTPKERPTRELVGNHFVPPVRARMKLARSTLLNRDLMVPSVWARIVLSSQVLYFWMFRPIA